MLENLTAHKHCERHYIGQYFGLSGQKPEIHKVCSATVGRSPTQEDDVSRGNFANKAIKDIPQLTRPKQAVAEDQHRFHLFQPESVQPGLVSG